MTATLLSMGLMLGLKSLIVAAVTLAVLRLARRRSPAQRSTIAHLGLFALVALPLASLWPPALSIALPSVIAAPAPAPAAPAPAALDLSMPLDAATTPASTGHALTSAPLAAPLDPSPSMVERAASLARYAYALPALALLLLTGVALLRLVALRSRAQVLVDPHWVGALARAQHRMGFKNGTALLTSAELHSPISWGLLRPTILVNEGVLASGQQAEAVLAHELAHVIHMDWAKLMLARVATAAFWFNPLAWVLAREAHQLREEAADDAVLAANIAGTDYAELLVGVARHENRGLLLGAHGVAPGRHSLRRRVARVLDKTPARGPSGPSWVAGFTAGMMVMAAPLAAVTFGPAQASGQPATQVTREAAQTSTSWSTRAGEAPNQLSTQPRHGVQGHGTALADAVNGLHDDASPGGRPDGAKPEAPPIPGSPEFAGAMAQWGAEFGQRFADAFTGQAVRPAPAVRPMPPRAPQGFNFTYDFDNDSFTARYPQYGGKPLSEREVAAMAGVTEDYRREMAQAGYPNAALAELVQARSQGVTADYIEDLRSAGFAGASLGAFAQARTVGLSADYIEGLRDAGMSGSMSQYVEARNMGVTGDYIQALKSAGLNGTLHDYGVARAAGLTPGYVRAMAALGVNAGFGDYQQLRAMGVTPAYVRTLHDHGDRITSPRRLIELKSQGYQPSDRESDDP